MVPTILALVVASLLVQVYILILLHSSTNSGPLGGEGEKKSPSRFIPAWAPSSVKSNKIKPVINDDETLYERERERSR